MTVARRLGLFTLALVLAAGLIALVVHTPPVRRLVLRYTIAEVQRRYAIRIDAARLDYNLVSLSVGLAQIRIAAGRTPDLPFFEAEYVRASLPRRALMGVVAFDDIAVTNGRVRIVRDRDGRTNLPESSETPSGEPAALDIAHLSAPRLIVDVKDAQNDRALGIPGLTLDIGRRSGQIALTAPASLSMGARQTRVSSLNGGAAFDGRALTFTAVQLRADEASAQLDGTLSLLVRDPSIDVHVAGTADVERLARWGIDSGALPRGSVAFDAHATGAMATPVTDLKVSTPRLTLASGADLRGPRIVVTDLAATSRVTTAAADVSDVRFGVAGGRVTGKARVPFDESPAQLTASWSDVDAAALTTALAGAVELAPAGSLSGELAAAGPLAQVSRWSATVGLHADGGVTRRGRLAIPGDTRLQVADGRWRIEAHHRLGNLTPVAIVAGGVLDDRRVGNSTIAGRVDVAETNVPPLLRLLRTVGLVQVADDVVSAGTSSATVSLAGRLAAPEIDADIHGQDLAGAQFSIADARARVSGQPATPRLSFDVQSDSGIIADQQLENMHATGQLNGTVLKVDAVSASQAVSTGRLSLAGTYDLRTDQYDALLDVMRWNAVATADQPLAGQVDVMFRGAGSLDEPRGSGSVRVADASWRGTSLGDLLGDLDLDGRAASVTARAPALRTTFTGRVTVRAPYDAVADVHADDFDLGPFMPRSSTPVLLTGRTTVVAHAEGSLQAWRDGMARVDVLTLAAAAGDLPIRLAEPAHLGYEQHQLRVDKLEVDAGATRLSASGELPLEAGTPLDSARGMGSLALTATGDIGEAARAVAATGLAQLPIAEGSGPLALSARVTGSIEKPIVVADLAAGPAVVTIKDLSTASDLTLRAHLERDMLDLREAHATYEGAMLNATGSVPLSLFTPAPAAASTATASLHATATGITPAVLRGVLDPATLEDLGGAIDVALNLEAPSLDPARATGDLTFTRLDLLLAGLPITQRVPTRIVARDGFARVESWNWAGEGATVGVFGQMRLADRQAAIIANGDIDLRVLTPFVRSAGVATAGRLTPRISVTGPIDSPRIDGDVALEGGEVRLVNPRIVVNGLTARAALTRTTMTLAALNGSMNGGALTGSGSIEYGSGGTTTGLLAADIRDMALEFPAGLRSELNAMLALDLESAAGAATPTGRLAGTVTVLRGEYREPLAVVGGLLTSLRARQVAATAAGESSPLLGQLALDIRLQTDEDIIVNNNVARGQLGADLRIIGTALAPTVAGRAEIREGSELFVGRNVYQVESGALDFANPTTIDPDVMIQASTRVGRTDVEIAISGPATQPSVELSAPAADTPLGQADLVALLLTGRTLDQLSTADASFIGTQVIGNLSGEVLGFAGRALGLDTLRLGGVDDAGTRSDPNAVATEVDPTSRLTFGKSLGTNVDVTLSQSLRDATAQTWIVEYLPARRVELRLVSLDSDLRSYGFRHDVSFGGSPASAARPASARRTEARVADVTITGQLAFPEERVRALLKLRPGDTFDFARWQDDRDRLEDFYHRNGRLAARVNASRATDGDVAKLSYVIDTGPQTTIAVAGVQLDRGVMQRLADAWAASIFDAFLVDEATQIVKGALAQRGYLQPMVTARVVTEGDVKTLRIEVQPGNRSAETRIRIQGPDESLAKDLEARIAERRLVEQVIRDPGSVLRDLTEYLRSRGYLRAKVTAGPPLFEENVAVVPITVDAGSAFLIGTVAFEGRQGLPADEVATVAAVMTGMPYDPAAIDAARDRLLALYRSHGFASAAVTPRAVVRPTEPRVDVTFDIQEGARQTVGDIVVSGNSGVDADVITRAMRLTAGGPLEPAELLRARARVFDTGLFRRVDVSTEPIDRAPAGASQSMRVRVEVETWPALRLRYGFQATEEHPESDPTGRRLTPGLSADVTRRTLFGRAVSLGGAVLYQRRENSGRALLNAPTLMTLPIQSSLVLERAHQQPAGSTFVTDRNSVSAEQRLRKAGHLTLSYWYRFERNHTVNTAPNQVINFDIKINIAKLISNVAWDTRNDPLDATRGSLFSSSLQWAPDRLGSQFQFVKYVGQAYRFANVHNIVLASAARVGLVRALGGQELYIGERFFAGGTRTVRGVDENSLGPRDVFGDPAGGEALLVLNQEARMPIYKWLRGVAFIDAGNVFPHASALTFNALTGSIGVGVRLATPFALLRADYGRVVWGTQRSGRWVFGIGQAF